MGGIIGSGIHIYSHYSEGRMEPDGGLIAHIVLDFGFGIFIALLIASIVVFVYHLKVSMFNG